MYLFYGVLCLSLAALLFSVTLLGARNPVKSFWAGEGMVANVLTPLILGFLVMGFAFCVKAFMAGVWPGFLEWGYAALITLGTVGIIMMMRIGKKLAAFEAEVQKSGEVIQVDFQADRSPETPVNDNPGFRKAA